MSKCASLYIGAAIMILNGFFQPGVDHQVVGGLVLMWIGFAEGMV